MGKHTHICHAGEGEFRLASPGNWVRDLGTAAITGGELTALVVRIEPEGAYVEKLHRHEEGFSLAYVLHGWLEVEFEEIGVQHLGPATVVPAFNGPMHRELRCGDDFELFLLITRSSVSGDDRQRIVVRQKRDATYEPASGGYRARDFGLTETTGGRLSAHALEAGRGGSGSAEWCTVDHTRLLYVADGWVELDDEDVGRVRLEKGALLCQPPGKRLAERAHGEAAMLLEVRTPNF